MSAGITAVTLTMEIAFERVQLMFGLESIIDVIVANNMLYIAVGSNTIVRIDLGDPTRVVDMQLPSGSSNVRKLFVCPWTGAHLIVLTSSLEYFYVRMDSTAFRALTKLRRLIARDITWNPNSTSRRLAPILIASSEGILEYVLQGSERYLARDSRSLASLWSGGSIESIAMSEASGSHIISVFALRDDASILRWSGTLQEERQSFQNIVNGPPEILGIAAEGSLSGFSLKTSPSRCYAVASAGNNLIKFETKDNHITEVPLGEYQWSAGGLFLLSDFHIFLVIPDSPSLLLVNTLNGEVFKGPSLPNECKKFRGVFVDAIQRTYWIWTQNDIYEIKLEHENRGISALLAAQHRYEEALEVAPHQARRHLYTLWATHMVKNDKRRAAKLFANSDVSVENAALNFVDDSTAMAEFLSTVLKTSRGRAAKVAISTWLVEIYTSIKNIAALEKLLAVPELLDTGAVLQILRAQGLTTQLLSFMERIEDWTGLVDFYVAHERWSSALDVLRVHETKESVYKHANVLLKMSPKETCESFMRIREIDAGRLLPALVQHATVGIGSSSDQAVRYLHFLLSNEQTQKQSIYHAIVAVYALQNDNEQNLLNFLKERAPTFSDHDFSLRVCLNHQHWRAATYLLSLMGLYEEAVNLSLQNVLLDEASEVVDQLPDGRLRKHLLLEVAAKTIASRGPQAALKFVGMLRVDDLLDFFPEFDSLDELAPEIVKSLERAKVRLGSITDEMEESLRASKEMHDDSHKFSQRSVIVEPGEPCAICTYPLVTRHFYVFPCQHAFHSDCLSNAIKSGIDAKRKKKLDETSASQALAQECVLCSEKRIALLDISLTPSELA